MTEFGSLYGEELNKSPILILDLVGLNDEQVKAGGEALGGDRGELVSPEDEIDYEALQGIVFKWGNPKAVRFFEDIAEEDPDKDMTGLPFLATAIVGDETWALAVQNKDWEPPVADEFGYEYTDETQPFVEIPFLMSGEPELGDYFRKIKHALDQEIYPGGKPVVSKIGPYYVRFHNTVNIPTSKQAQDLGPMPTPDDDRRLTVSEQNMTRGKALEVLGNYIEHIDFELMDEEGVNDHVLQLAYWTAETFGDTSDPKCDAQIRHGENSVVDGEDLPTIMKNALIKMSGESISFGEQNTISITAKHVGDELAPEVPGWDKISKLPTYKEWLEFAKNNPQIIDGVERSIIQAYPQVSILFTPGAGQGWELEFSVNPFEIAVLPSGERGKTKSAFNVAVALKEDPELLAKTMCQLAHLAAKTSVPVARDGDTYDANSVPSDSIPRLQRRLENIEDIPLKRPHNDDVTINPGNALKKRFVDDVLRMYGRE